MTSRSPTSPTAGHQAVPQYAIVVDQLRGWQPGAHRPWPSSWKPGTRTREPEPDLEAEP